MKQRAEIIFEMEEKIVLRQGEAIRTMYCPNCLADVAMTTPLIAAFLSQTGEREIFRMIEQNAIHFIETVPILICLKSLNVFLAR